MNGIYGFLPQSDIRRKKIKISLGFGVYVVTSRSSKVVTL